jgi:hypothetical protein
MTRPSRFHAKIDQCIVNAASQISIVTVRALMRGDGAAAQMCRAGLRYPSRCSAGYGGTHAILRLDQEARIGR